MTANPWLSGPFDVYGSEQVITQDDLWRDSALCSRLPRDEAAETFFPETIDETTISKARRICRVCPVFDECRQWGNDNFPAVPDGILFGMPGQERGLIFKGRVRWRDWRFETGRISRRALAAREREALRHGVPAVVDAHRYYEITDPVEQQRVVTAYQEWQDAQRYPSTLDETVERVEKLSSAWLNTGPGNRRKSLPPELRPQCPDHGPTTMYRHRRTPDGRQIWACILMDCEYRTVTGEPVQQLEQQIPKQHAGKPACPNGHRPQDMEPRRAEQCWRCYVCKAKVPYPAAAVA